MPLRMWDQGGDGLADRGRIVFDLERFKAPSRRRSAARCRVTRRLAVAAARHLSQRWPRRYAERAPVHTHGVRTFGGRDAFRFAV